jgi:hypothetical protein
MSKFREGETSQFPVDRKDNGIWYGIIAMQASNTSDASIENHRFGFTSSGTGKREFIDKINELKTHGISYLLLGIWQGQYSTDIFVLDERIIVKRIKLLFPEKYSNG